MSQIGAGGPRSDRRGETVEDILGEIDRMIGLENVKAELRRFVAFARLMVLRRERDLPAARTNLHMAFSGPPGTGKTVMARKVARVLKAIRLLRKGHCVEVDRSNLVASYVGQTATKTREVVESALDGVLFIDEAYTLTKQGSSDTFGQEAVDTLLRLMENYRDRLVVIIAGYGDEIDDFIESNVGLKSRFSRFIDFEGYDKDQLLDIFTAMVEDNHFTMDDAARRRAARHIADISRDSDPKTFGNAREVRGFFEKVITAQAERLSHDPNLEHISNEDLQRFTDEDVLLAAEQHNF